MTPDVLKERLAAIPSPSGGRARERTVAAARAEVAGRSRAARPGRRRERPRLISVVAAAALVAVVLLTPPGRAASAWVGRLVGVGEVGGPPSEEKRGDFVKAGTAIVIDNGTAPDGSRYEWVAYQCKEDLTDEGTDLKFEGIGVSMDWPGVREHEGGGTCEELEGRPRPRAFSSNGVHVLPSQMKGVAEPDLVISGITGPDVHRVAVIYTDGDGDRHELPVDFARVEGKLRQIASRPEPLGTFVAFLPGDIAARDELESRLDLRALQGTGKLKLGPIGRREREQARVGLEKCAHLEPDPASIPRTDDPRTIERFFRPLQECHDRYMPRGPFEYIAYDANGRVLDRMTEPLVAAMSRPASTIEAEGREEPGDRRARRHGEPGRTATKMIMSGRAPDGALYEVYFEKTKYGTCMWNWWPYGNGNEMGACGPEGLPPSTAFGRRNPEQTFAKPYGFLNEAPEATRFRYVTGFARPGVERVELVYRDRDGGRHAAPVRLVHVRPAALAPIDVRKPFEYWIAFVPRSAGHRPIEVTAHSGSGEQLGVPFTLRSP